MKETIAIATTKVKRRIRHYSARPSNTEEQELESSKAGLGTLFLAGTVIGIGGILSLISGLIQSGSLLSLLHGWLTALLGG